MEKNEMPIVGASAAAPVQAPVAASNVAAGASAAAPVQAPVAASNVAAGASAAAPVQAPVAASNVAAGASAAAPVQAPFDWDPYEPVQYDAPENPYDTTIVDYAPEVESSDVDSDDESFHTKTRHVLRRLQSGQYDGPFARGIYKCPFCNRRLRDTDFNTLLNHAESIGRYGARVGRTVNVHAYMAKHKALGIHLRNLQASHTRHLEALNVPTALSFLTAPSCSELQISPDPSPSISPESSLYTTGVHHRSDYAAWTPSSTDAATSHLKTPLRRRGIPDSLGPWLQWRYVSPESLALPCSNKKLKLGESLSWKETSVEPAPVCKVFGRIDEENTPDSFCKVLCTSELEVISIPSRVLPWFYGGCPESINLKMSTACTWIVDLKQQDGNVLMDKGWPEFVKAHDLKVGYLLTFKKLDTKSLQVLIFGYNCCEKVIWCSGYHPSLGQQYESQLY
ncbi:hypothetical protein QYE76_022418 [Lolium multiflorum]|uniref:TF-B3 domain-containing protein n=1 Tax=Lolium multiflorum TaxID=4521 RepID=A0AAD8RA95_LOLMU|nr:hypothetical protein QYE76_022418 [Lolium multiflorum]